MPDTRVRREPISRSESSLAGELQSNACGWSGATSFLFGLLVDLFLMLVAAFVALVLYVSLKPQPVPWLPEVVNLITSVDTRLQRATFLITAIVFAAVLAVAIFVRPKSPLQLRRAGEALSSGLDRALRLADLGNVLGRSGPRWLAGSVLFLCFAIALAIFAYGQIKISTYTGDTLLQVVAGDPHIYTIFGRAGETLAGRFAADTSSNRSFIYGFGPAAIYALGRHLGVAGSYYYSYQISRWSSLVPVIVLFWALFRPQFSRLGYLSTAVIVFAASLIAIPLLFPNSYAAYAANLSGLRYMPMIWFIIAACVAPPRTTWISIFALSIFAALGLVYAMDVGIVSLIGYIAFVGLERGRIPLKILRILAFMMGMAIVVAITGAVLWMFLSVDLLISLKQLFLAANNSFGGILVKFSLLDITIIAVFVVTATALVFSSRDRALDQEERFVAAVSIMGFVWYSYYLHRPGYGYWIYTYLALFNLRYVLGRTSDWGTAERRIGAVLIIVVAAIITQQNYVGLKLGRNLERTNGRNAYATPISMLSGIRVGGAFADAMSIRMSVLDQLRTPDCVVVTGFPYLVTTATKVANPPHDIVFGITTEQAINSLVSDILARRPSRVFLEPTETAAWGPELMHAVVSQIEKGISPYYERDESVGAWRVWNSLSRTPTNGEAE